MLTSLVPRENDTSIVQPIVEQHYATIIFDQQSKSMIGCLKLSLQDDKLEYAFSCVYYTIWIMLPVAGWIAESWIGRYKAIVAGLLICTITVIFGQFAFIMLNFDWTPIPAFILMIIVLIIGVFGFGSFYTIMLPFILKRSNDRSIS